MFDHLKTPRQIMQYNLFKGVTDWTNLKQFDYYEKGYPFLLILRYPKFIEMNMQFESKEVQNIVNTYLHILENEFIGLEGIQNLTSSSGEFTNGIKTVNYINKVEQQSGTFTMTFKERSGLPITKFNQYYLTGIKDKETQVKHYHGLIDRLRDQDIPFDPGVDKETFTFLYFVTDNTMCNIEAAYLICAAQPTEAQLDIADQKKGEIDAAELSLQFQGICLNSDYIDQQAQNCLNIMRNTNNSTTSRVLVNSTKFAYREASRVKAEGNSYTSKGDFINPGAFTSYEATLTGTLEGEGHTEHSIKPGSDDVTEIMASSME